MNLSMINTNCIEGRWLMAAIKELEFFLSEPNNKVLAYLDQEQEAIYKDNPLPEDAPPETPSFENALTGLINQYSKENDSGTPDFILQQFICGCMSSYAEAVIQRDKWFGHKPLE